MGENADHVAFLVDGYVAGPAADHHRPPRAFPKQYLHYHRAGHGAVTSPNSKRGYTAFVLSKMARLQGASGIHTGTMGYGKMEGEAADKAMAYMITEDSADGPFFHQEWYGMNPTTPIISGGMNALRMPGFFENLGHSNLIMTAGGSAFGHIDGGVAALACVRPNSAGAPEPTRSISPRATANSPAPSSASRMTPTSCSRLARKARQGRRVTVTKFPLPVFREGRGAQPIQVSKGTAHENLRPQHQDRALDPLGGLSRQFRRGMRGRSRLRAATGCTST